MKHFCLLIFSILPNFIYAQNGSHQLELESFVRYDKYPPFSYAPNPNNSRTAKISGTSLGVGINYRFALQKSFYFKVGVGYYQYSFDKIQDYDPLFGNMNARLILFRPENSAFYYACHKYRYNCASINIAPEYHFATGKYWSLAVGLRVSNYLTFSQTYYLSNDIKEKLNHFRYLGLSVSPEFTFLYQSRNFSIGPKLITPFFDNYKQDKVFPGENNSRSRSKWFNGFGVGISVAYSLIK